MSLRSHTNFIRVISTNSLSSLTFFFPRALQTDSQAQSRRSKSHANTRSDLRASSCPRVPGLTCSRNLQPVAGSSDHSAVDRSGHDAGGSRFLRTAGP